MRWPAANRTISVMIPRYIRNDTTNIAVLAQFQWARVPFSSSQYSGPTAVHSASHRPASTASVQRCGSARARKMRVRLARWIRRQASRWLVTS